MNELTATATPTTASDGDESRREGRRRSLAFFALVVLVAVVAGIVELSLTVWDKVGAPPGGSGRAASLSAPANSSPPATTSPGPGRPGTGPTAASNPTAP